jgi:hypothetical protein
MRSPLGQGLHSTSPRHSGSVDCHNMWTAPEGAGERQGNAQSTEAKWAKRLGDRCADRSEKSTSIACLEATGQSQSPPKAPVVASGDRLYALQQTIRRLRRLPLHHRLRNHRFKRGEQIPPLPEAPLRLQGPTPHPAADALYRATFL